MTAMLLDEVPSQLAAYVRASTSLLPEKITKNGKTYRLNIVLDPSSYPEGQNICLYYATDALVKTHDDEEDLLLEVHGPDFQLLCAQMLDKLKTVHP